MQKNQSFSWAISAIATGISGSASFAQCIPQWAAMPAPSYGAWSFATWDPDGSGPAYSRLVAGSGTQAVSFEPMDLIRQWDGRRWLPIGNGVGGIAVYTICSAETSGVGSPAPGLYAGGVLVDQSQSFLWSVAHFDGQEWKPLHPDREAVTYSLAMFDEDGQGPDEPNLFVGAAFKEYAGQVNPGILRWDGTEYSLVGGILEPWHPRTTAYVNVMTVFDDDGPGPRMPALYVGGNFMYANGQEVNNIARWDGTKWESLGIGTSGSVQGLTVFDPDGEGPGLPMLYAGGQFPRAGGIRTNYLAKWDGKEWSGVGGFTGGGVKALATHDPDGDGPQRESLFITGYFYEINGVEAWGVARWDGQQWHDLDIGLSGLDPSADAFGIYDEDNDPSTPAGLYIGGCCFQWAGGGTIWSPALVRWGCPISFCHADCDTSTGNGVLDIFDFLCFQNSFVTADPYACDCDITTGNGVCDIFDFLCFQDSFVSGCP